MKNDNRGLTMVEILVSFTVLTIVMLVFYNCIKFCGNMMAGASDIDRENNAFQSATTEYFKDGYELNHSGTASYDFKVKIGSAEDYTVTEQIPYSEVYFEYSYENKKYTPTTDTTGDVRKLVLFSTKD